MNGPFARYVAIGDSSTEGLVDPDGRGGFRGWADRLAALVAAAQHEPLLYANLAVRGRKTREVRDGQLPAALAMQPDLASVFSGTNDVIRRRMDLDTVLEDIRAMQLALRRAGATVLTITLPDLSDVVPMGRGVRDRLLAMNDGVRRVCAETGTLLLDLAGHPLAVDPRLWHEDRLHANAEGHRRIALGLAERLGIATGEPWDAPLPPLPRPSRLRHAAGLIRWSAKYFAPWLARRLAGRSSGDGIEPKRPALAPVG